MSQREHTEIPLGWGNYSEKRGGAIHHNIGKGNFLLFLVLKCILLNVKAQLHLWSGYVSRTMRVSKHLHAVAFLNIWRVQAQLKLCGKSEEEKKASALYSHFTLFDTSTHSVLPGNCLLHFRCNQISFGKRCCKLVCHLGEKMHF